MVPTKMEAIKDDRFSHISSDPQFRKTPKSVRKVKIDKRFQSLFTDKRFHVKYTVDKRGRPVSQSSQENFKKYYELSSSDDDTSDENEGEEGENVKSSKMESNVNNKDSKSQRIKNKWAVSESKEGFLTTEDNKTKLLKNNNKTNDNMSKNVDQEEKKVKDVEYDDDKIEKSRMTDEIKMKLRDPNIDYARGVGTLLSDSSSEEDTSSDSEAEESGEEHEWGELDRDADTTEEATERLACLHMDWDRIRAVDLMVLFNSFLPPEGVIESVTIYPSQFGLARMKEEEERGPPELLDKKSKQKEELDEESKEGKQYHMERLRQYQLNRLKYYYAIIKFDSSETANKVYTECDGLEYESSATKLDLRFVPEEETFDEEPHEVCTSLPEPSKYEPRIFTNTALQQGKVELTWDETDPSRQEFTKKIQKNIDSIDDTDLQAYLASSSEDEDTGNNKGNITVKSDTDSDEEDVKEEDKIARYKSLLASLEEEEEKKKSKDVDLEITWGVGLKEKAEKSIKDKLNKPQTPFEEMLEKQRQKKILKRESKLKQKENEQRENDDNLYSDDDIPSDVDLNDPFFNDETLNTKHKKKKKDIKNEESTATKQQAAELELLLFEENDGEQEKSHFNFKSIQEQENQEKKKKRRKQLKKKPEIILPEKDDFQLNVEDDRFSALYTSHLFNVDPANPQFRKTKAMDAIISEKLKRRKEDDLHNNPAKITKMDPDLSSLVKSIKTKCK